ncbi:hypothetical protein SOASR015_34240 [Pectobacterium carotovorum subsp. carotovorum]|nr:hypothetical protein SOASR015_34240 [Pectobacterium carotovorum subsp. carotovorum]GLX58122.1 hypothetical protein Pcaca02_34310 [Pectobacterium carotovorum subsp. carotovorum]
MENLCGEIAHLVIDSSGLKVFGEGEWKAKKHGAESGSGVSAADRQQQVMERENGLSPAFSGGNGDVAGKKKCVWDG